MTTMTPAAIAAQISACDAAIIDLEGEAQRLALAATEGKADAAVRLAEINREIEAMKGDRFILTQAQRAAEDRAAVQADTDRTRQQAADREEARACVARLLDAAGRADALVQTMTEVLADLADAEAKARSAAMRAGGILNGVRIGQEGAVAHAVDLLTRRATGAIKTNTVTRSVEDFARVGWRELIEGANDV